MFKDHSKDYNAVDAMFVHNARRRVFNSIMTFAVLCATVIVLSFKQNVPTWLLYVIAFCDLIAAVFVIRATNSYHYMKTQAEVNKVINKCLEDHD